MTLRSNILIAHDGQPLDELIWREAGLGPSALPDIMSANPGTSNRLTLNAGDQIIIPAALIDAPTPTLQRRAFM